MTASEVRRRPGGRSAKVRAAVITATLETLAERGPGGLTVAEVAKRSAVHETSIYRRWGTRERLALDAMSELSSELLTMRDTGSIRGDLVALGEELVGYAAAPLGGALLRTMASTADDEQLAAVRAEFWRARFSESGALVARAVARGELPEGIDARLLLELFVSPIHFRLLLTSEDIDRALLERLADAAVRGAENHRVGEG